MQTPSEPETVHTATAPALAATLTDKQKRFCEEYIRTLSIRQAALNAGYSETTATQSAYLFLKNPAIHEYIDSLRQMLKEKSMLALHTLINQLTEIALADTTDIIDVHDTNTSKGAVRKIRLKLPAEMPDAARKSIIEIRHNQWGVNLKTYNKLEVVEQLAKLLGLYQKHHTTPEPVIPDILCPGDLTVSGT